MPAEYSETDEFIGARFVESDLTGALFRGCDLRQVKIADSWLIDVNVSGELGTFYVNDVEVSGFVESELDRRHPERTQLRQMQTADDYRAMWDTLLQLWQETVGRAERLPEAALYEQVDEEWSFVETLRHLIFATDAWASRTILDEEMPYHPIGRPHPYYPAEGAAELGVDLAARPTFAEALAARASRQAVISGIVAGLTDSDLQRVCTLKPAPHYPDEERLVGRCLRTVMREECEHRHYAVRDLSVLESRLAP